jgi:hypothetical protein
MVSVLWVMTIGNSTSCWIRISGHTWPFYMNQFFGKILSWPPQKMCIQKMLLTNSDFCWLLYDLFQHTVWLLWIFEVRFQHWSGFGQTCYTVLGQVFGPKDEWNLLGSEYMIWRSLTQLSDAYSNTHFWRPQPQLWPFRYNHVWS